MLQVKNVSFSYTDSITLNNIDFSLEKGMNLAVIGESGCGKSTLLKLIYGLYDLDKGSIFWNDVEVLGPKFNLIPGMDFMKYLAQDFDLMPFITVAENIGKYLSNSYPEQKNARIAELLEIVEMTDYANIKAKNLSGGQMQRVALARVLALEPEVLLLDEPSAGLSPALQDEVFVRVREINRTGVTVIMVEQNARRCLQIVDRGYVLDQGRNAYTGTGKSLANDPKVIELYLGTLAANA